jgi:hypothetical protein
VFLIACPGPWINGKAFATAVQYELFEHARTGHGLLFVNTGPGAWYHLTVSLRYGLGLPLLLLSCVGLAYAAVRREPADILLLVFVGVTYAATSFSAVRFARYLIPLYPALCLAGARVLAVAYDRRVFRAAACTAGFIVAGACLLYSAGLVNAMAQRDPRDRAADYLTRTARPNAVIAFAHVPWFYSPPLSPLWGAMPTEVRAHAPADPVPFQLRIPADPWEQRVLDAQPDYVIVSNIELNPEMNRLRLPDAIGFMSRVRAGFDERAFSPAPVPWLSPDDPDAPQDLLYALAKIYLYTQRRR